MISKDQPTAREIVEYGDYQTPAPFAAAVCRKLRAFYGLAPMTVIEPTFGNGGFFRGILSEFPGVRALYGVEINEQHYAQAMRLVSEMGKALPAALHVKLFNDDIFSFDFGSIKKTLLPDEPVLIVGNPPWGTNARLSLMGSSNLPVKSNFKKCSGLDAITGKGNFDLAETIIIRLLHEFGEYDYTLAMLCKSVVAKNMVRDMNVLPFNMSTVDFFTFDAREVFGTDCDAGLLVIRAGDTRAHFCSVYDLESLAPIKQFGWSGGLFCSDLMQCSSGINGACQFEWRQGIKHDCSKVMELKRKGEVGRYENGFGEICEFRLGKYVYPLAKSSDIRSREVTETKRCVIVPQKRVGGDTSTIKNDDPSLWSYLTRHENLLSSRKSVLNKKSPPFSIFGVGDYSFAKYKVGISGFYKTPVFSLVHGEYPVMLDDTCYFIGFDRLSDALFTVALLNQNETIDFLRSIAFLDSKRPYTKEILKQIDLLKLARRVDFKAVAEFAASMPGMYSVTEEAFDLYRKMVLPI
ncbi:MAG: hypothetical protein LBR38_02380 [Synergistaceae bacterium]|nr:hypothetical protein [Synergistaceae bacterium]